MNTTCKHKVCPATMSDTALCDCTLERMFDSPTGYVTMPNLDGMEIKPGVFLIGNGTPRPDLGPNKLACLANVDGMLCTVELSINLLGT